MTDDNQNPSQGSVDSGGTPSFGSGDHQPNGEVQFGKEDLSKILKQNANAQTHIKTLESETATLRNELQALRNELAKARTIDELLNDSRQSNDSGLTGSTTPQLDAQALLAKLKEDVFSELTQAQRQAVEAENWETSISTLKARYGDRYAAYVDSRARELDMSIDDMESLARTKPKAFMELVDKKGTGIPSPTIPSQRSALMGDVDMGAQYSKLVRLKASSGPEGREAAQMLADPGFQAQYRQYILDKARREGTLS